MANGPTMVEPNERILVEIDGPDVTPANLNTRAAIELIWSYLNLIDRFSQSHQSPVAFYGLQVVDKCAAVAFHTSDASFVRRAVTALAPWISGAQEPPRGLGVYTESVRHAIFALPEKQKASVLVGNWKRRLRAEEPKEARWPSGQLIARAEVIKVGGSEPKITLRSDSELRAFTLSVDRNLAREAARHLYGPEVQVFGVVRRDSAGLIVSGALQSIFPINEVQLEAATDSWREWFRSVGGKTWDAVEDIEGELDREGH